MKAYVIKNKEGKYYIRYIANSYNDSGYVEFGTLDDAEMYEKRIGAENTKEFIEKNEYKFHIKDCEVVEITIAEGDLEEENRVLTKAYLSACEKLSEVFGECPYSNMNLPMPEYCDEKCVNNEKYLCWDKYFIKQAKGESK